MLCLFLFLFLSVLLLTCDFSYSAKWVTRHISGNTTSPTTPTTGQEQGGGIYGTRGISSVLNVPPFRTSTFGIFRNQSLSGSGSANAVVMFGGKGKGNGNSVYNDLWSFDIETRQWMWVAGTEGATVTNGIGMYGTRNIWSSSNVPGKRAGSAVGYFEMNDFLFVFGGHGYGSANASGTGFLNDVFLYNFQTDEWVWKIGSKEVNQSGIFGSGGIGMVPVPGGRYGQIHVRFNMSSRIILGGFGQDNGTFGQSLLNDVFVYSLQDNGWTWVAGSESGSSRGQYGVKGGPFDSSVVPGGRFGGCGVEVLDSDPFEMLLFGGYGLDSNGDEGYLSDTFHYREGQFRWTAGENTVDGSGIYGVLDVYDAANLPGARRGSRAWVGPGGSLMCIFGGKGFDVNGDFGMLNDLFCYDGGTEQWAWRAGTQIANDSGLKTTTLQYGESDIPSARMGFALFPISATEVMIFGGEVFAPAGVGVVQDLWQISFEETCFSEYDDLACSGLNGTCSAEDTCLCSPGYTGDECELLICSSKTTEDPAASGTCSYPNGTCVAPDDCLCSSGYSGSECEYMTCFSKTTEDPSGSGTCSYPNGTCVDVDDCLCSDGYSGDECEVITCHSKTTSDLTVCGSPNGTCTAPDHCLCFDGFSGDECDVLRCHSKTTLDASVCSSPNGTCVGPDDCLCFDGYAGEECQYIICGSKTTEEPTVCSSPNGTCVDPDECICSRGYAGLECQYIECYNKSTEYDACNSPHGHCVSPENCFCPDRSKWTGIECEIPYCFGILNTSDSVCSGYGYCESYDSCECDPQHHGSVCNLPVCYGIVHTSIIYVCSGRGTCVAPDDCLCSEGYHGPTCSIPECFGLTNESTVCSSRGRCSEYDICVCQYPNLHGGDDCGTDLCGGLLATDESVCSTRGQCVDSICVCETGSLFRYTGDDCEIFELSPALLIVLFVVLFLCCAGVVLFLGVNLCWLCSCCSKKKKGNLVDEDVEMNMRLTTTKSGNASRYRLRVH